MASVCERDGVPVCVLPVLNVMEETFYLSESQVMFSNKAVPNSDFSPACWCHCNVTTQYIQVLCSDKTKIKLFLRQTLFLM